MSVMDGERGERETHEGLLDERERERLMRVCWMRERLMFYSFDLKCS